MTNTSTILPHNQDAEAALLGSILINPEAYFDAADMIEPEDFFIHRHRWIWEAFLKLNERHCAVDLLTMSDELERADRLAEIGGPAYLTSLINLVPTSLHAAEYARIVSESAIRRRLLEAANRIAKTAYQENIGIEQALNEAEKVVLAVSGNKKRQELIPVEHAVSRVYDQMTGPEAVQALPTGFSELDRLLCGGQRNSELIVVAGRPGMGKSSLLLSIVRHTVVEKRRNVALFSLEMDSDGIVLRLLSQISGVDLERLRTQQLRTNDWEGYNQASEQLSESGLYIDDTPALTPNQLRTRCRRLQVEHELDLIALDYLQLMNGGGRFENRTQEVSHISRSLKLIARELDVPILAAAQLSRGVDQRNDKRPVLADLRESGAIEQDSDIVMFLYRPELYDDTAEKGITKLTVAKQRNGPTGEIDLFFRSSLTRFENLNSQAR